MLNFLFSLLFSFVYLPHLYSSLSPQLALHSLFLYSLKMLIPLTLRSTFSTYCLISSSLFFSGNFEFRNHVALVFQFQAMNLRETLYKHGKDVGINIGAVRMYARQLLSALRHLEDLKIVHADIKLDNILCSEDLKQVTLCDFGSAFLESDKDIKPTTYIVSRFYRAPEIILGLPCKIITICNSTTYSLCLSAHVYVCVCVCV